MVSINGQTRRSMNCARSGFERKRKHVPVLLVSVAVAQILAIVLYRFFSVVPRPARVVASAPALALSSSGTTISAPLPEAEVFDEFPTYSKLKQAVLDRYGYNESCKRNPDDPEELFTYALQNMAMVEEDGDPAPITNHTYLYVGSSGAAYNQKALLREEITHIVSATRSSRFNYNDTIEYYRVPVGDDHKPENSIYPWLSPAADFIERARQGGGKVLVHCHMGRSRSVSVVIGHLMKYRKLATPMDAIKLIWLTRPHAAPNSAYWRDLHRFGLEELGRKNQTYEEYW